MSEEDLVNVELMDYLSSFLSPERKERLEHILSYRTKYLTVILEDIIQPQNASAVIRSAECFGLQQIHIIDNYDSYKVSKQVVKGSAKWIDIEKYKGARNTITCLNNLKSQGYKIYATTPHTGSISLTDFQIREKTALVFGNEHTGVSKDVMDLADGFLKVPMHGFTESLNISACAAICIQNIRSKLDTSDIEWRLTEKEAQLLKYQWIRKAVRKVGFLERQFFKLQQTI